MSHTIINYSCYVQYIKIILIYLDYILFVKIQVMDAKMLSNLIH